MELGLATKSGRSIRYLAITNDAMESKQITKAKDV